MKAQPMDAVDLLTQDHNDVRDLFTQFEGLGNRAKASKQIVADHICDALTVHSYIEDELFFPELSRILEENLIHYAQEEHAEAEELIAEIKTMSAGDRFFDEKVTLLAEEVETHVQNEEENIFPLARESDLDLAALGAEMAAKKEELESQEIETEEIKIN